MPLSAEEIGDFTSSTRVLISFGGAFGGFEFAMQLRRDIMSHFARATHNEMLLEDDTFCYIDAISLAAAIGTDYPWNETFHIYKMQNPNWAQFYQSAMARTNTMIFMITEPWLNSWYCWQEWDWFIREKEQNQFRIKPIFVIFPEAEQILNRTTHEIVKKGELEDGSWGIVERKTVNPKQCSMRMLEDPHVSIVEIRSAPIPFDQSMYDLAKRCLEIWPQSKQRKYFSKWMKNALETVQAYDPTCERGAAPAPNEPYDYRYTFRYQCSDTELNQILAAISYDGS